MLSSPAIQSAEEFVKNLNRGLQDLPSPSSKAFPGVLSLIPQRDWATSDTKHAVVYRNIDIGLENPTRPSTWPTNHFLLWPWIFAGGSQALVWHIVIVNHGFRTETSKTLTWIPLSICWRYVCTLMTKCWQQCSPVGTVSICLPAHLQHRVILVSCLLLHLCFTCWDLYKSPPWRTRQTQFATTLRKVHVVIFTPCGDFCGGFHHKCKSPHVLVVVFATRANHHMYLWWFSPQVQITTSTCGDFVQGWVNG